MVFLFGVVFGVVMTSLIIVVLTFLHAVINGFVIKYLWTWFIVPVTGFHELTIPMAIGMAMVVSFLTKHQQVEPKEKKEVTIGEFIGREIMGPFLVLLLGYVITLFI